MIKFHVVHKHPQCNLDDLSKAREKAKQAETESEVESERGERRRRKKTKRIYDSDDSNENSEDSIICYPITRPPSTPSSHTNSDVTLITHDNEPEITLPNISSLDLTLVDPSSHSLDKNAKQLVTYLSFVGGSKVPTITRRILEKLFTNKLALLYNWTGENVKLPLKNMQLIKVIRDAIRHNKIAEKATDSEIQEVIANWFRFTKDRNGGRETRRTIQKTATCTKESTIKE
ncbi:hypothetical protein ACJJTC_007887 [Scirpophaga incertulas]